MIVAKNDFTNTTIRHQPVEFFVTVVERVPNVVKKDEETLKQLLDLIFKLMIDIDEDIDETWMRPKEGSESTKRKRRKTQLPLEKHALTGLYQALEMKSCCHC